MSLTCLNHQKLSDYTHQCIVNSMNWEAFTTIQQIPCSLCITQGYLDTSWVMGHPVLRWDLKVCFFAWFPLLNDEKLLPETHRFGGDHLHPWWFDWWHMVTINGCWCWWMVNHESHVNKWYKKHFISFYDIQGGWSKTFRFRIWQRKGLEVWWKWGSGLTSQEPKPCCPSIYMRLLRHFAAMGCSYSSGNEKRPLVCRRFWASIEIKTTIFSWHHMI